MSSPSNPIPLLFPLLLLLTILLVVQHTILHSSIFLWETYIIPVANNLFWDVLWGHETRMYERTYYSRPCDVRDVTARAPSELIVNVNNAGEISTEKAVDSVLKHGMALLPSVLSPSTSASLRRYIIRRNGQLKPSEELSNINEYENRKSFGICGNEDESVVRALKELTENVALVKFLEELLGTNPAFYEFSSITSSYGASPQPWHADLRTTASALTYARSFATSYAMLIPLQNTTSSMGATDVCPGTHYCHDFDYIDETKETWACKELGFPVSGKGENSHWEEGTGLLYNSQMFHRGGSHTDPTGPDRVVLVLTFAPRPQFPETRMLPLGTAFGIRSDMWGYTLYDLAYPERFQWWKRLLRTYGIWSEGDWGWDKFRVGLEQLANVPAWNFAHQEWYERIAWWEGKLKTGCILGAMAYVCLWLGTLEGHNKEEGRRRRDRVTSRTIHVSNGKRQSEHFSSATTTPSHRSVSSFWPILYLALASVLILLSGQAIIHFVSRTPLLRSIEDGQFYSHPFSPPSGRKPPRSIENPNREDILFSPRFNVSYLAANRRFLDYHPGNAAWRETIDEFGTSYALVPLAWRESMVKSIVATRHGKFLRQNDWGMWDEIGTEEAKGRTRALLEEQRQKNWAISLCNEQRQGTVGRRLRVGKRILAQNRTRANELDGNALSSKSEDCGQVVGINFRSDMRSSLPFLHHRAVTSVALMLERAVHEVPTRSVAYMV